MSYRDGEIGREKIERPRVRKGERERERKSIIRAITHHHTGRQLVFDDKLLFF